MNKLLKVISFFSFLFFLSVEMFAQSPHPYFRNFTTEHGLPSSEVHYTLEGDNGIMWFATDNGLSRFDGYSFKNYGPKEGLKHHVALFLQKAPDGTIWIATLNGHLYFVKGDKIIPFEQNKVIEKYGRNGNSLFGFHIDPATETKYISIIGAGVLAFYKDNTFRHLDKTQTGRFFLIKDDRLMSGMSDINGIPTADHPVYQENYDYSPPLFNIVLDTILTKEGIPEEKKVASNFGHLRFNYSDDLYFTTSFLYQFNGESLSPIAKSDFIFFNKSIFQEEDGSIYIGFQKGEGLKTVNKANDLITANFKHFLKGKSISHIYKDSNNAFWISTIEHGVFYTSNFQQKIFDTSGGLTTDYVAAIAIKNKKEIYIGLRNGDIFLHNNSTNRMTRLQDAPTKQLIINDLFYDKKEDVLWAVFGSLAYFKNEDWIELPPIPLNPNHNSGLITKSLSYKENSSLLWGTNNNSFGAIDLLKKEKHFSSHEVNISGHIYSIKESLNGRIWVGVGRGLLEFKDNKLIKPSTLDKAFESRVEDLDELADTTLVIATKGAGVLLWKDDYFKQFTKADGLTSDMIENIHVDPSGKIWVGTLAGLNTIISVDTGFQIKNYTMWHGLPSNEITQVRSYGDQIWVATSKGLMQWFDWESNKNIPVPIIEKMLVNNQEQLMGTKDVFSHKFNNFRFHFLAINYRMSGKIPYRFRLNKGPWNTTQNTSTSYTNLVSGKYTFEVQSQTEDGHWSKAANYQFTIQSPWWATWWFRALLLFSISGIAFAWYNNRTKRFRKENALLQEINQLERKALQAQMNPHFIFNCLNSIQNAILQKDNDQAVTYLTKFASFTRWVLKSSNDGKVVLEEEIHFLGNYLSLEKLRFKNKFDYHFEIDKNLSLVDTFILPLMIQPIVENAVKHGMKRKKNKGIIKLTFTDAKDSIHVKIRDNGHGIFQNENKSEIYQPMGMSITKRRLEVAGEEIPMKFTELKDEDGNIEGTEVSIFLKKL